MNNTNKDMIIIGCSRSGKTTLANMIMEKNSCYHNISLDGLTMAFKKTMPELGIKPDSKLRFISKKIIPFLVAYLDYYKCNYPNKKYLIEGLQINPDHLMEESFFHNATVICLGFPNAKVNEIFDNIRREDEKLLFSYTKKIPDDELKERILFCIKYSKFLQEKCKEYGIPFYETNHNRNLVLNRICKDAIQNVDIDDEIKL